jgi:hypothetical protein
MVRQTLKQIEGEKDAARLQQMLTEMQQAASQVPPEMKPALDLILKRVSQRLASLPGEKK